MNRFAPVLAAVLALGAVPAARAADDSPRAWSDPAPRVARVVVRASRGPLPLRAVLADSESARVRGLGGLALGKGEALLYDFEGRGPVRMWTRDDKVALDMAFVAADGIVAYVRRDVPPGDATPVTAGVPVRWVVEMAAGTVEDAGIAVGDAVAVEAWTDPEPGPTGPTGAEPPGDGER